MRKTNSAVIRGKAAVILSVLLILHHISARRTGSVLLPLRCCCSYCLKTNHCDGQPHRLHFSELYPRHFPWCMVGQDLNHSTLSHHPYDYKQSACLDKQVEVEKPHRCCFLFMFRVLTTYVYLYVCTLLITVYICRQSNTVNAVSPICKSSYRAQYGSGLVACFVQGLFVATLIFCTFDIFLFSWMLFFVSFSYCLMKLAFSSWILFASQEFLHLGPTLLS